MRHRYSEQDDAANYGSGGDQETDDVHEAFCLCRRVPHRLGKYLANELRAEEFPRGTRALAHRTERRAASNGLRSAPARSSVAPTLSLVKSRKGRLPESGAAIGGLRLCAGRICRARPWSRPCGWGAHCNSVDVGRRQASLAGSPNAGAPTQRREARYEVPSHEIDRRGLGQHCAYAGVPQIDGWPKTT